MKMYLENLLTNAANCKFLHQCIVHGVLNIPS